MLSLAAFLTATISPNVLRPKMDAALANLESNMLPITHNPFPLKP
ncbi:hypothetical protein VCRA2123O77_40246 [Vibrio crassostreae]|nr:hypothetical protein VCRA2119O46_40047 [Vibrio crassostreae]CAK2155137.1 hypothetical protein VCRA2116O26_50047 [Vibrio crassostreae]CAK2368858.1 hypothetical protein VCRA2119O49_40117 [Vibrio crassostreae]CAK2422561.1 hypothetical protein VCRA2119O52_1500005 [Vibrio crassostreae]CAK2520636.1 hypothetical protein VCRA2119O53_40048 [Vibrio crassostreae]